VRGRLAVWMVRIALVALMVAGSSLGARDGAWPAYAAVGDAVDLFTPETLRANGAELRWSRYSGPSGAAFDRYELHRSVPARRGSGIIRLFEADPDLLVHVAEAQVDLARKHIVVSYVDVPKGVVEPPVLHAEPFDFGFLVLDGLLLRRVEFVGKRAVEVLGPGNFVRPWRPQPHFPSIPSHASWKVCEPARLAVLDRAFEREVARWPGVVSALLDRFDARSTSLAMQLALAQLPRLEVRLLCLLWHLATSSGASSRRA